MRNLDTTGREHDKTPQQPSRRAFLADLTAAGGVLALIGLDTADKIEDVQFAPDMPKGLDFPHTRHDPLHLYMYYHDGITEEELAKRKITVQRDWHTMWICHMPLQYKFDGTHAQCVGYVHFRRSGENGQNIEVRMVRVMHYLGDLHRTGEMKAHTQIWKDTCIVDPAGKLLEYTDTKEDSFMDKAQIWARGMYKKLMK